MFIHHSSNCGDLMELTNLFFGAIGRIFSYSSIILILILMFIITLQLFLSRRKKAYFSLTVSLVIIIFQYLLLIIYELKTSSTMNTGHYMAQVLHVFAFIIINMGIFQLYNTTGAKEFSIMATLLAGLLLIAGMRYYNVLRVDAPAEAFIQYHNIWIELYLIALAFLGFYLISPFIGQQRKYQVALLAFLSTTLAGIANDYLLETPSRTLTIIEYFCPIIFYMILFIMIFHRVVELLQAIYNSSIKDGLTGLFNRPFFFNRVADYIHRGVRISVLFCDIDNFKKLNDTRGHQTGDRILKQVAAILQEESKNIGIAGRYGGEELVVMLTDTSLRVENVAERIRRRVEAETDVTISIGFSKYSRNISPQELLEQADQAMYQAKRAGKNRVIGFTGY